MIITEVIYQAWRRDGPEDVTKEDLACELNEFIPDVDDIIVFASTPYKVVQRIFHHESGVAYIKMKRE